MDVDIVGYGQCDGEDNDNQATSVLLPVATAEEVDLTLSRVLPGLRPGRDRAAPIPRRARWLRWFDFWTLRYGWDDRALITENGWMIHQRNIVPHAKTQSVRIEQGPLQRRLGLADVHVDTPKGPVNAVAHQLDARGRPRAGHDPAGPGPGRAGGRPAAPPRVQGRHDLPGEAELLAGFGTSRDRLLGAGGETEVFALDEERVLRLYRATPRGGRADRRSAAARSTRPGRDATIGIEVPLILEAGELRGRYVHHRPAVLRPQLLRPGWPGRR